MMPPRDQVGTPSGLDGLTHLSSSTTSGTASRMTARTVRSTSPRQSSSPAMASVIRASADAAPALVGATSTAPFDDRELLEVALHLAVPLEARDRAPPARLHVPQRGLVLDA